jgi:SUMO ligase MMS21 Smc5/6 complex component
VKAILIEVAVSKGDSCPISMNPITKENAAVTSCGHVFDRDSIAQWLASSDRHGCPNCREHCVV